MELFIYSYLFSKIFVVPSKHKIDNERNFKKMQLTHRCNFVFAIFLNGSVSFRAL